MGSSGVLLKYGGALWWTRTPLACLSPVHNEPLVDCWGWPSGAQAAAWAQAEVLTPSPRTSSSSPGGARNWRRSRSRGSGGVVAPDATGSESEESSISEEVPTSVVSTSDSCSTLTLVTMLSDSV